MNAVPIAALSRLNAHARAGRAQQRDAIYAYKTLAAIVAGLQGDALLRFVRWTGKCTRCTNGRFKHWSWDDGYTVRCRDCSGTTIRSLQFTETRFADGTAWHHPWNGMHRPGHEIGDAVLGLHYDDTGIRDYRTADGRRIDWQPAGDWSPNKAGEELPLAELVPLINQVEDWVDASEKPAGAIWAWERARRHLFTHSEDEWPETWGYLLTIGRAPGGCFACGDASDLATFCYGRISRLFHWSLPVCKRHSDGPEKAAHPKDPPPEALITPDIRRWLDRHQRMWERGGGD